MEEVRSGKIPFSKLDVIHRRMLERIRSRFGLEKVDEPVMAELNLAWHRLDAWPGRAAGAASPAQALLARAVLQRQHLADGRSRAAQRLAVGRDSRRRDRA